MQMQWKISGQDIKLKTSTEAKQIECNKFNDINWIFDVFLLLPPLLLMLLLLFFGFFGNFKFYRRKSNVTFLGNEKWSFSTFKQTIYLSAYNHFEGCKHTKNRWWNECGSKIKHGIVETISVSLNPFIK